MLKSKRDHNNFQNGISIVNSVFALECHFNQGYMYFIQDDEQATQQDNGAGEPSRESEE
jgi:hypothetical protein